MLTFSRFAFQTKDCNTDFKCVPPILPAQFYPWNRDSISTKYALSTKSALPPDWKLTCSLNSTYFFCFQCISFSQREDLLMFRHSTHAHWLRGRDGSLEIGQLIYRQLLIALTAACLPIKVSVLERNASQQIKGNLCCKGFFNSAYQLFFIGGAIDVSLSAGFEPMMHIFQGKCISSLQSHFR